MDARLSPAETASFLFCGMPGRKAAIGLSGADSGAADSRQLGNRNKYISLIDQIVYDIQSGIYRAVGHVMQQNHISVADIF